MEQEKTQIEDEVNLMDYLNVILKRKWLIFLVFILAMAGAGVFSYFSLKIFRTETILEIGEIGRVDEKILFIESHTQIIEKIETGVYKHKLPEQRPVNVEASNPENTNLIIIRAESENPEQAKKVLQEINKMILQEHQEKIRFRKENINREIEKAENQIKLTEDEIKKTKTKLWLVQGNASRIENKIGFTKEEKKNLEDQIQVLERTLIYEQTPGTQFALFSAKERLAVKEKEIESLYLGIISSKNQRENLNFEIKSLEKTIKDLNARIVSLKSSLEEIEIKSTRVIKSPLIPEAPIKPRPLLNISIAGILGIFFGTFLAFFKEFWEKNRSISQKSKVNPAPFPN